MEKSYVSGQSITITNPSELVINIDEYLRLSKKVPLHDELLQNKEDIILGQLGERKTEQYPSLLMFEPNLRAICDQINDKYQDGFYLEDEYDIVQYPYDRTIRTKKQALDDPIVVKELSPSKITAIKVGKYPTMENAISLKKFNTSLLISQGEYENEVRIR